MMIQNIQKIQWKPCFEKVLPDQYNMFGNFIKTHPLKSIKRKDKEITYLDCGEGEKVLLFLHGAFLRGDMFFYTISQMENEYRIIAPTFPMEELSSLDAIEWIKIIRKTEKIQKFCIIGYSFGGGIAQALMYFHPEWLQGVVLTHTSNLYRKISLRSMKLFAIILKFVPFKIIMKKMRERRIYSQDLIWYQFHQAYFEERIQSFKKQYFIRWIKNLIKLGSAIKGISAPNFLKPMVLLGTKDDVDAFPSLTKLQELYPHAKTHIFDGEGGHHYIFLHPKYYTKIISSMIGEIFSNT